MAGDVGRSRTCTRWMPPEYSPIRSPPATLASSERATLRVTRASSLWKLIHGRVLAEYRRANMSDGTRVSARG